MCTTIKYLIFRTANFYNIIIYSHVSVLRIKCVCNIICSKHESSVIDLSETLSFQRIRDITFNSPL